MDRHSSSANPLRVLAFGQNSSVFPLWCSRADFHTTAWRFEVLWSANRRLNDRKWTRLWWVQHEPSRSHPFHFAWWHGNVLFPACWELSIRRSVEHSLECRVLCHSQHTFVGYSAPKQYQIVERRSQWYALSWVCNEAHRWTVDMTHLEMHSCRWKSVWRAPFSAPAFDVRHIHLGWIVSLPPRQNEWCFVARAITASDSGYDWNPSGCEIAQSAVPCICSKEMRYSHLYFMEFFCVLCNLQWAIARVIHTSVETDL